MTARWLRRLSAPADAGIRYWAPALAGPTGTTAEQRRDAAMVCAGRATDAADLRMLLDMLGLLAAVADSDIEEMP